MSAVKKIVILGGGFGGVYTALELEKQIKNGAQLEVTLISQENFLLFTPMLHEVAASDLDPTDIVNPIHKLLHKVQFFCGSVDAINLEQKEVRVSHGQTHHSHTLPYDHLVLALGNVTNFFDIPGLKERALTMKSLGDAIFLRNQVIALLEEANFECCKDIRSRLLTFMVAGGGFSGVETVAALHDFIDAVLPLYRNLTSSDVKVILVHPNEVVLTELDPKLGKYAQDLLIQRGVEVHSKTKVSAVDGDWITLTNGSKIETATLVWTAGTSPHPLLTTLSCTKERGKILVKESLDLSNHPGVWAAADCAAVPDGSGKFYPPTAQHAVRQARQLARNIIAFEAGQKLQPFKFKMLGQLASLGHRRGVAQVCGIRFSGFAAWVLWRTIYLAKLPRLEKRVRVAISWTLDLVFRKDNVQLPVSRS